MNGQVGNNGYVYFIRAVGTSRVKLGFSADPEKRLRELQTASPYKLVLLWKRPGTLRTEQALHRLFKQYRVQGEWFQVPRHMVDRLIDRRRPKKREMSDTDDPRLWRLTKYTDRHGKVRVRKILRFIPRPEVKVELGVITDELAAELEARDGNGRWRVSREEAERLRETALAIAKRTR